MSFSLGLNSEFSAFPIMSRMLLGGRSISPCRPVEHYDTVGLASLFASSIMLLIRREYSWPVGSSISMCSVRRVQTVVSWVMGL